VFFFLNIRRLKLWWCVLFPLWIAIRCHTNICAAIYSIPHIIMATVIKLCPHCPLFSHFFLVSPSSIPSIFPFVALRIIPVCSLLFPFSPWFLDFFMIYSIYRIYSFNPTTNHGMSQVGVPLIPGAKPNPPGPHPGKLSRSEGHRKRRPAGRAAAGCSCSSSPRHSLGVPRWSRVLGDELVGLNDGELS